MSRTDLLHLQKQVSYPALYTETYFTLDLNKIEDRSGKRIHESNSVSSNKSILKSAQKSSGKSIHQSRSKCKGNQSIQCQSIAKNLRKKKINIKMTKNWKSYEGIKINKRKVMQFRKDKVISNFKLI